MDVVKQSITQYISKVILMFQLQFKERRRDRLKSAPA